MTWQLTLAPFLGTAAGVLLTVAILRLNARSDRRRAEDVRALRAATPDCAHTGGPTIYDSNGRVMF